jgi:outer membrane lipoprotein-sorting protein
MMLRMMRSLLTMCAGLVLLGSLPAQPPVQPGVPVAVPTGEPLERRLAEIDERSALVKDLRADFEQRKHTALLREPLVSSGSIVVKDERVRWDTRRPRPSTMTIGGGEVRMYYPDAGVLEIYAAEGDLRDLSGSPLPRLPVLRRHFDLASLEPSALGVEQDGERFVALELTPKNEALRDQIARVRVVLDSTVPAVTRLEMTDPDGDRTELAFTNIRVNTGVAESELELHVPAGTRTSRPGSGGAR